jgi:hypothetical protein
LTRWGNTRLGLPDRCIRQRCPVRTLRIPLEGSALATPWSQLANTSVALTDKTRQYLASMSYERRLLRQEGVDVRAIPPSVTVDRGSARVTRSTSFGAGALASIIRAAPP